MTSQAPFFNRRFLWGLVLILPLVIFLLGRGGPPAQQGSGDPQTTEADITAPSFTPVETRSDGSRRRAVEIESWQEGGARVLFVRAEEVPILDLRVVFNAGGARDGDLAGLAAITSSLLSEGTTERGAQNVAVAFESVGAEFSTSSYRDMAVVELRSLADSRFLEPAVDMVVEVLAKPAFEEAALARKQKRMIAGVQRSLQSPGGVMSRQFYPALYSQHPYGSQTSGTPESIPQLTRSAVEAFYRRYYNRKNAVIVLVGAIDRKRAEELARRLVSSLTEGVPAEKLPEPTATVAATLTVPFNAAQTHIRFGMPSLRRDDPDLVALMVGNEILGGGGLTSELNRLIREERGLAYSVYSFFSPMQVAGPFGIGLQTRSDQADEAIALVREALAKFLQDGPTAAQVETARRHLAGSFPLQTASNASITGYLGAIGFYKLPLDYLDTYVARINAVSRDDILQAFRRHVSPEQLILVRVGPAEEAAADTTATAP